MLFKIALTLVIILLVMVVFDVMTGISDQNNWYKFVGGIVVIMINLFTALGFIGLIWN